MSKNLKMEVVFVTIIMLFAIITTKGYTIAWGLLPLLFAFSSEFKKAISFNFKTISIVFLLFAIVFSLNFFAVYNFQTNELNIPHPDFNFYLKIANYFNQTGVENNLTAKTVLFDTINYATPYRFFDTWLMSLLLVIFPFSDLQIMQLIYLPILFFMVSYSVFKATDFFTNSLLKVVIAVSFLFLFGDSITSSLIWNEKIGEICVVSYPKLAIFFCVFIYYFKSQLNSNSKHNSILILAVLPILIQTSFSLYIFIYGYLLLNYKYFLKNKKIVIAIVLSSLYFVIFYAYNSMQAKSFFQIGQFQMVKSIPDYLYRIASIVYNLIKSKIIIFLIISLLFAVISNKERRIVYLRMIVFAMAILASGAMIYAFFPASSNSYQLMSNFTFPVFISLVFLLWLDVLKSLNQKFVTINVAFFLIICGIGAFNQYNRIGFFSLKNEFSRNESNFVNSASEKLQKVNNPIGLTYWSEKNVVRSGAEHFDQYGTNFLIKIGGKYDLVCLSSLQTSEKSFADKTSKHYSAISLFQRLNKISSNFEAEKQFYKAYNFDYLFSDLSQKQLPDFMKNDVSNSVFDAKSGVYLHFLK